MKVRNMMSGSPRSVSPTESIACAAALMADADVGALPVVDDGSVVGIVTDRDLAIRGLATGLHGGAPVFRAMTRDVATCRPDDELADVLVSMAEQQVRRMPVCSSDGELVGMVSLSDAARIEEYAGEAAETLGAICLFQGRHCQSRHAA
jgi:CBS domain-containing protein